MSENNSDEITIKYGCDASKKEECKCEGSSEESCDESEEIIVKRPKPCGLKSSEELDIKTWIRPCCDCQFRDVSSEEVKEKPCPVKKPCSEIQDDPCSSEEHIIDDSQNEEDSFESKPKLPPCKCKNRLESSEELFGYVKGEPCPSSGSSSGSDSGSSSEECQEVPKPCCKKLKPCPCRKIIVKPAASEESEEVSGVCDRWSWIRPKPVQPISTCGCIKKQPKRKCSSCKQESSDEQQAIFY